MHPRTLRGDSTDLRPSPDYPNKVSFPDAYFDAVVTEPDWSHPGHEQLDKRNLGHYPFESVEYRELFDRAWNEVARVLKTDGLALVVIYADRTEANQEIVTDWHEEMLAGPGLLVIPPLAPFRSSSGEGVIVQLVKPHSVLKT